MIYAINVLIPPRRLENRFIRKTDETDPDNLKTIDNDLIVKCKWKFFYIISVPELCRVGGCCLNWSINWFCSCIRVLVAPCLAVSCTPLNLAGFGLWLTSMAFLFCWKCFSIYKFHWLIWLCVSKCALNFTCFFVNYF